MPPDDDMKVRVEPEYGADAPWCDGNERRRPETRAQTDDAGIGQAVAIIGMAGRFPGAGDLDQFWRNLESGRSCVTEIPRDRFDWRDYQGDPSREAGKTDSIWGCFLDDVSGFDAAFFGISPRDAARMDPQQRLFMEAAWTAVEDAGYRPSGLSGSQLGVFVGVSSGREYANLLRAAPSAGGCSSGPEMSDLYGSVLADRVARSLDVNGPCEVVSTACTSSLVAIHRAMAALRAGDCDMALAGGVKLLLGPDLFIAASRVGILTRTGASLAFDRRGDGFALGEGVGAILLKPLGRAIEDRDAIRAVIRGSAVNHSGATASLMATDFRAQARAATRAVTLAGLPPSSICYVEVQGSATEMADATELEAIDLGFRSVPGAGAARRPPAMPRLVGCLKPNIGHLEAASGIAAVIKVVLAMRHRQVPGIAGFEAASERLSRPGSGFRLSADMQTWETHGEAPRRAAVNGFGFGGVNAHVILEEAPPPAEGADTGGEAVIVVSARDEQGLRLQVQLLRDHLALRSDQPPPALADVAFTLQVGRQEMAHRLAVLADDGEALVGHLDGFLSGEIADGIVFRGEATAGAAETFAALTDEREGRDFIAALAAAGKRDRIAALWVAGCPIPWTALPEAHGRRRVPLPTTRFDHRPYWLDRTDTEPAPEQAPADATSSFPLLTEVRRVLGLGGAPADVPDPLLQRRASDLGLDSLRALELRARLQAVLCVDIPVADLLAPVTLGELAGRLPDAVQLAAPVPATDAANRFEPFQLTDIQLAYLIGRADLRAFGGNGCHILWEFDAPEWDLDRLEKAWNRVIGRHDMLRAVFGGDGRQRVLPEVPVYRLEVHDWRNCPAGEAADRRAALHARMSHECFVTDRWPLFRIAVSIVPEGMRLHLSLDLLMTDGIGVFLLLRDWADWYADPGRTLPPIGLTFRDYVLETAHRKDGEAHRRALEYWHGRLDALPPAPDLPQAADAGERSALEFRRFDHRLPAAAWNGFRTACELRRITPAAALIAAFAEVLACWATHPAFTLNLTIADRQPIHPDVGLIVGDFTSNLLLEVDGDRSGGFADRAGRLARRLVQDLDHVAVSGVHVIGEMTRRRGSAVLMPVVFTSMLGYRGGERDLDIDALGHYSGGVSQTPQVWLDAQVMESRGGLLLSWDAVEALFPPGLIAGMFEAYTDLVERLADTPTTWDEARPTRLPAGQADTRGAVNATARPLPAGLLHEGFVRMARERPDLLAVAAPGRRLSYGELLRCATALAQRLAACGAAAGEPVAIVMSKGWEQVAAAIAASMAGAPYLPVDAALPTARIAELLALGGVRIALVQAHGGAGLPGAITRITVAEAEADGGELPVCAAGPDDLAYVIFTSGSTGTPKGVMISHRAAANTLADLTERFGIGPADRVLALSSLSFDLSVFDIFGLLGAGGAVVLPHPDSLRDPHHLARLAVAEGVTVWNSVPSYLQLAIEAGELPELRLIMLSGDWIPLPLVSKARELWPHARLESLGGATEAAIWSIHHTIGRIEPDWKSVPYGTPLANQSFHVLDENFQDCPDWVPGQLHIAGAGLASGYWRDDERTRAAFPIHPATGERLYRTGDWGRYLPDGTIEFLGRRDLQVKVGGHRVELGEIEAVLGRCPGIDAAVAAIVPDGYGQNRLAAGFIAKNPAADPASIRQYLKDSLPAYMVPSVLRPLDRLPLTANGKIDRKVLPTLLTCKAPDVSSDDRALERALSSPGLVRDAAVKREHGSGRLALRRDLGDRPRLTLPDGRDDRIAAYDGHRSCRRFAPGAMTPAQAGTLLGGLRAVERDGRLCRLYPSSGGIYPVQTYLHAAPDGVQGLDAGFHYYDPIGHALVRIDAGADLPSDLHLDPNRGFAPRAGMLLLFVADLSAIRPVYGDAAVEFALIETGAMLQILRGVARAEGVGLCQIGALRFDLVRSHLRLGEDCRLVHAAVAGLPADERSAGKPAEVVAGKLDADPTELIAATWRELLQRDDIGHDENFFDAGGDSFLLVEMYEKLAGRIAAAFTVTDLFRFPTIRSQAGYLTRDAVQIQLLAASPPPASRRELRRTVRSGLQQGQG